MSAGRKRRFAAIGFLLACATVALLAACGGSSTSSTGASAQSARRDPISHSPVAVAQRPMRGTGGNEVNDDNPGKADSGSGGSAVYENPCALISRSRAQAIIGKPIAAPQEAQLGPTCIYHPLNSASNITLELESANFDKLKGQLRKATKVESGANTIYCGSYGGSLTLARINSYRLVKVSAPCSIGPALAAEAIERLKAHG